MGFSSGGDAMEGCKIYHLLGIEGGSLLLVFHTNLRGYQFSLVTSGGKVMGEQAIFYTANAALTAGLRCLEGQP
jgi:hypothetical protein